MKVAKGLEFSFELGDVRPRVKPSATQTQSVIRVSQHRDMNLVLWKSTFIHAYSSFECFGSTEMLDMCFHFSKNLYL